VKRTDFAKASAEIPGPGSYRTLDDSNIRVQNTVNFSTAPDRDTGAFAFRSAASPFAN